MLSLTGYQILEQIHDNCRTQVYRGIRQSDGQPVAIKLHKSDYPSYRDLAQFRHQYTLAKNLNIPGIIKPYSLETYGNSFALIMEDFGGISLSKYTNNQPLPIDEFLSIALQIVKIIEGLHHNCIIHKDIKPQNLLINPQTQEVKLIDFSISSLLPRETQEIQTLNILLEGTLAYIAPEQTGRMNRGIDYRTDFYSLGVTFYELLTGQLPCLATDPMEIVHCHIAKTPLSPIAINPTLPEVVNDIILKLMAKNAEDRYQNAYGIRYDLEICQQQWQSQGKIVPFPIGKRDICDRFLIPEKLYGREREVQTLLQAFENRVAQGNPEILLVAGFSGIGKTAVVNEIHKPIVRSKGYFIKGKFDQFNRNIPLSGWVEVFRELTKQLLIESSEKLQLWKTKIIAALGENAQVIIEVIPELEQIIGSQPAVAELSGNAAQNRFNLLFCKFVFVFATQEHPLVIFLDDLQWADSASLNLLQILGSESETRYLLLMGAYRDNEVNPAHPLPLNLEAIKKTGITLQTLTLTPLSHSSINHLIADALNCPTELASPLTEWVYQKTKGNPFFTNQFLKYLHEEGMITFDFERNCWQCDLAQVRTLSITDDVVEFMAFKLQNLPELTQQLLKIAACIGNSFDLNTLSIVAENSLEATACNLWFALQEGVILPINDVYKFFQDRSEYPPLTVSNYPSPRYKFLHDRVQQAAYSLIPDEQKQATHLKIGQLLLNNTAKPEQEEKIFEIVNQLNYGLDLILNPSDRYELAQLNLIAGRKAKTATAYTTAVDYLTVGRKLINGDSWQNHYETTLNLYAESVEAAYLNTDFEQMEELAKLVLDHARTLLDKVKVYEVQLSACTAQVKLKEALEMGLEVLKLLGVSFPTQPSPGDIQHKLEATASLFIDQKIADFVNLPEMVEPDKQVALRILSSLVSPAYMSAPALLPLIILEMVQLSVYYGNAPLSAFAYGLYGLILSGVIQEIQRGYEFGQLALNIVDKLQANYLKTKIFYTVGAHLIHGKQHFKEAVSLLEEAYVKGLETGELETGYSAKEISQLSYLMGGILTEVEPKIAAGSQALIHLRQEAALNYNQIVHQAVLNLLGQSENPCYFGGQVYHEEKMLPFHIEAKDRNGLHYFYFHKLIVCYVFGEVQQAWENATQAEQYLDAVTGMVNGPIFYFYDSLIRLAIYFNEAESEQQQHLLKVQSNQEKLKKWANSAPMNFLHKFYLVEAERYRVLGETVAAIETYDLAINGAHENNYLNEKAIANELAAKFYLSWNKEKIAQPYLVDAYYAYAQWGAKAKVQDLEKRYTQLLAPIFNREQKTLIPSNSITSMTARTFASTSLETSIALDLMTVMKASQAIKGEVELDRVLAKLMQIVLENAGAQSSVLILNRDAQLFIEATGSVDAQQIFLRQSIPVDGSDRIPLSIVNYVSRTHEDVILTHASKQGNFINDPYIINHQNKSILCTPILGQGKLIGILYLENNVIAAAFTSKQTQLLKLLCSQAAISLENAQLYEAQKDYAQTLEHKVQELQKTETELRQSEERYRSLVIATSKMAWIWMTDAQGRAYDIPALREYTGQTIEEVSNWGWLEALHSDDRDRSAQVWMQAIATKSLYETEYRLRAADGSYRYFSARGVPILAEDGSIREWVGICADIHDRKQAEIDLQKANEELEFRVQERTAELQQTLEQLQQEIVERQQTEAALQESQRALSTLIKNLPGIAYRNRYDKNWTMEFVSEGCFELTGYHPEDLIENHTLSYKEMTHPEDRISVRWKIETAIALHQPFEIVYRIITAAGKPKWVWEKGQGIFSLEGEPIALEGFITDISDRKLAEAALQEALAAADAASRAKGEFLSKMSHELRTPLNAILGFSQILNRDVSLSAQQQEYLGIINRAGEHLLTLINDVLEMSKIEAGRIELHEQTFDLYNLLNSLEEMFQLKASSKGLQLIFNISQDIPQYIKTDESKLRQVLINLIGNAIKFTKTGNVTLRIKAAIANNSNASNPLFPIFNSQLYFEIEDTGPGIAPEEIDSLFEAFVQTAAGKQSQSGTGLGLPISRQFVQLMGGEITVSSILNQGSIFKFNIQISLPKDTEFPKLTLTQRAIALEPNQPNYRILVVEDQPDNRLLLVNLLSQVGFEVRQAVNSQEAVTLTESWQPHLIWMDIQMPIMNGYEATKRIRSLPKLHPIIIALTANAFAEDKANILATGCDDFVSKPFREAVIFEKMTHYLGVRYVYEKLLTQKQEKPKIETIISRLTSESLPKISLELNAQLYQAAQGLDDEKLGQLTEQIRESHPILYNNLAILLKQLRFDKIIELLEKLKND
ncbi:AAA family ATPase [Phormidium sp. LEGE 05292]|uniref:AAA family ATPase n=1 Tax=[Phormidium] sp. LEGE 05292 TaxID=767427 RepID=UPI001880D14F|nr:AAA family ATPase [Phormidium sp. LEGE 05292]MBE9226841.1 AAA family ATPase [Phormidium sp. LEGE 05292]